MRTLLRSAAIGTLTTGLVTLVTGGSALTKAQLVGQGSTVLDSLHAAAKEAVMSAAPAAGIVTASRDTAELQLLLGMLLILAGFFVHSLYVVKFVRKMPRKARTFLERNIKHAFTRTLV